MAPIFDPGPPAVIVPPERPAIMRPARDLVMPQVGVLPFLPGVAKAASSKRRSATFMDSARSGSSTSSPSFANCNIGDPSGDRRVIVVCATRNNARTIQSVTIGGVAADLYEAGLGTGNHTMALAIAHVPTGSSVTISMSLSGSNTEHVIGWWVARGLSGNAPIDTDKDISFPHGGTANLSLATGRGGFVIAGALGNNTAGSHTYVGATRRYLRNHDAGHSGGDAETPGSSISIQIQDITGSNSRNAIAASW